MKISSILYIYQLEVWIFLRTQLACNLINANKEIVR